MKSAPWNTWIVRDIFCTQKGWTLEKKMNNLALDGSDLWLVHAVHTKTNGNILLSVGVCAVQWCCCGVVVNRRSSGACISPSLSCKTHDFIEAIWPIERATRWCLTRTVWCWWTGVFFLHISRYELATSVKWKRQALFRCKIFNKYGISIACHAKIIDTHFDRQLDCYLQFHYA